ncbi:cytochrome P450 [Mycena rebaudengoi]|nr:cytochrome P450 [Mycena rebaudengoi]
MHTHWEYIVSGRSRTLEVGSAPDDQLSFLEAANDALQTAYTMGPDVNDHPEWHINVIRSTLTRNLGRCFPDVRDELRAAFEDILSLEGNQWKSVTAYTAVMDIVCRTSNRLFVGLPLCRNSEWMKLNIHFTIDVIMAAHMIRIIFGPLITSRKRNLRKAEKLLRPILEDRLNSMHDESRPNDLITWLLDAASEKERQIPSLVERILSSFLNALYDLAAHSENMAPLRSEVKRVVSEGGWTKEALGNMHQIDSFLRESPRINRLALLSMGRKVVNPQGYKFSDGKTLPYGAFMQIETGRMFNQHMGTTGVDYLPFGHGRHACPGRFFAATELKAMLAHVVVMNYDVKLDESADGVRPPPMAIGYTRVPNTKAKVYFRKHSD